MQCNRALINSCEVTNCEVENCDDAIMNDIKENNGKTTWLIAAVVGTSCTVKCDGLEFTTECRDGLWDYPQALEDKCGPQFG